jgi:uncharacterized membrane protein YedE/YeeE
VSSNSARIIIIVVVAVAVVVILVFVTGWADDKAKPGSTGRGKVTQPATNESP